MRLWYMPLSTVPVLPFTLQLLSLPQVARASTSSYQALVAAVQENDKAKEEAALAAFRAGCYRCRIHSLSGKQ